MAFYWFGNGSAFNHSLFQRRATLADGLDVVIAFPPPMERELEKMLQRGATGVVIAAWKPPEFDTGSRIRFVLARHHQGPIYELGDSALALLIGPLSAPALAEGTGHRIAQDLRTLDLCGEDEVSDHLSSPESNSDRNLADLGTSSWTIAVVTSRSGDHLAALERYVNHALFEGWLYGPNNVSIFDDEDRSVLKVEGSSRNGP